MDDVLVPLAVFLMVAFIVWVSVTNGRRLKVANLQAEMQTKLLDKLGSSPELVQYLESDAGRTFLQSATLAVERSNPLGRVLGSIQAGVILVFGGIGLLWLRGQVVDPEGAAAALVIGTLTLSIGMGFLVAAGLSYTLSKSWGLIDSHAESRR